MNKMNKKADIMLVIYMVLILFIVLILGLLLVFGIVIIDWTFDEVVPELTNLGQIGNINATQIGGMTLTPVNNIVQSFTWLGGLFYVFALVGCLGFAFAFRFTGNKWLMGFFIACMFMLLIASIFISNIYEDFYNDSGDIGDRLHENVLLSYMILFSPIIICIIGFFCGIIMFTGEGGEERI